MNQSVTLTFKIFRKTFVKQISVFIHHFLFHGANIVILTGNAHTYFITSFSASTLSLSTSEFNLQIKSVLSIIADFTSPSYSTVSR